MENSISDTEAQKSFHSPPRRRRSTFFERRDSLVPPAHYESMDQNTPKKNTDDIKNHKENIQSYYEKLLSEKEQWKIEVNRRRNKYHDLRQQYQLAAKSTLRSRVSYSTLTNEDIEFLKAKPNLVKLSESQIQLHKSVKEARALFSRVNELDNVVLSHNEKKLEKVTQYILENSTVEPVTLPSPIIIK